MKTIFKITTITIISLISLTTYAQDPPLGLIAQLTKIKIESENKLTEAIGSKDPKTIKSVAKQYNIVRLKTEQIILQLSADMKLKNKVKPFKKLNKYYQTNSLEQTCEKLLYTKSLASTYAEYTKLQDIVIPEPQEEAKLAADAIVELVLSAIELGWTVYKELSELNSTKVDGIIELLEQVRLSPPKDFAEKEKEEAKK